MVICHHAFSLKHLWIYVSTTKRNGLGSLIVLPDPILLVKAVYAIGGYQPLVE